MTKICKIPITTPWGEPQVVTEIAPGIVRFHTAGHGGIWLSPERNAQVPKRLRQETWMEHGLRGWYEEDSDAGIVALIFPAEVFVGEHDVSQQKLQEICDVLDKEKPLRGVDHVSDVLRRVCTEILRYQ